MVLKQCKLQDRQNKNGKKTRAEPMLDGNMTVHTDGRNLTARDLRTCSLWDTFLNDIFLLYRSCVEILKKIDGISDI